MQCPECGSNKIYTVQRTGEDVCESCGLVVDDFALEETNTADNLTRREPAFASVAGTGLLGGKIFKDSWFLTSKEKNVLQAKRTLGLIESRLRLPKGVLEDTLLAFQSALDYDLNVGRDNTSILLACLYAVCNMRRIPKTAKEITLFSSVTPVKLLRSYKLVRQELNLKVAQIDPADMVQRFGNRLNLKQETISRALQLVEQIEGTRIKEGRKPETIAAGALYVAMKLNRDLKPQREVANAVGVIELTVRKRSKEIEHALRL